jgi:hypothetical protein
LGSGLDSNQPEPNDGFIRRSDDRLHLDVESKLVPRFAEDVLQRILDQYQRTDALGEQYAKNRNLALLANRSEKVAPTLVRVSALADLIESAGYCPFDRVFLIGAVSLRRGGRRPVFHIHQSYPKPQGSGLAEVEFDLDIGLVGSVVNLGIDCF